ncbi:MAG: hypothetical protein EA421_14795 [Gemmatimonadales bacterium]|nr:MAG: hypothetical protein EA421_14795 [Gemmatimonadales bacterium]
MIKLSLPILLAGLLLGVGATGCGATSETLEGDPVGEDMGAEPTVQVEGATGLEDPLQGPPLADSPSPLPTPRFPRPESIRGIYLNAWAAGSASRLEGLIQLARRTEINTFVIDVKDDTGYLSHSTGISLARRVGADGERRIRDLDALLDRMEMEGIYPIARIVVFKDPILARELPRTAVQDISGRPWVDGRGDLWVNPWNRDVWDYNAQVAREVVEIGFPEIQWDYIRFPDRPAREMAEAVFPGSEGRPRSAAVRDFLRWTGEALADLEVPLTADVFGVTTTAIHDVGIGQLWEEFIDVVDAALPMVYPSHYWEGSYGFARPNAHPYEIVRRALSDAIRRTRPIEGAGRIIPWLQDFSLGDPRYGVPEVRAQILATYDAGLQEWILWNSAGRYTEGALEPVGGWPGGREPDIRHGSGIIPAVNRPASEPPGWR